MQLQTTTLIGCSVVFVALGKWVGLQTMDLVLVTLVSVYAILKKKWKKGDDILLAGSESTAKRLTFVQYAKTHHELLSCVFKGKRRMERVLAICMSGVVLLYWKVLVDNRQASLWQQIKNSETRSHDLLQGTLLTLVISKIVKMLLKKAITLWIGKAGGEDDWYQRARMQWSIMKILVVFSLLLCVLLFVTEGSNWRNILGNWVLNWLFALSAMDMVWCYIKFNLFASVKSKFESPRKTKKSV